MSEKLKPHFTPVPNVIFDEIMRDLKPGAVKLVFAICRYTYGWRKPEGERISLKQLQEMTGMSRWSVVRSLKQLGRLVIIKPGNATQASEYRLNIEISDADLGTISDQSQNVPSHLGSHLGVTFQRKSKERRNSGAKAPLVSFPSRRERKLTRRGDPDPAQAQAFARFYSAYPRHVGKEDALKAWTELAPSPEQVAEIMAGVERYAESVKDGEPKFIKHPGPWLNGRRWEDEPTGGNGHSDGPPKIVKRQGDMLTLADGTITPAGTYQRRYGIQP